MKLWLKLIPAAAVAGAALWWWLPSRQGTTGPRYRTASVARGDVVQTVTATGTISAVSTVEVGSQVSGNIVSLHADYNDAVKAGQLIAEIDPATYQTRVVQAEGDLASAQATLDLKQVAYKRSEQLLAQSLIAQSDFDQAKAELRQQEATVKIKEAALETAKLDLSHTKIYSPIDGVVISRSIDVGQTVQASFSAPELFVIAQDLRKMQIAASVSEADIGNVAASQPVTFSVDAFQGRTFDAQVLQVRKNATTTSNVVTYTTIISVDNSDLKLLPGMTANVVITVAQRDNVLRVANAALRFRPPETAQIEMPSGMPGEPGDHGVPTPGQTSGSPVAGADVPARASVNASDGQAHRAVAAREGASQEASSPKGSHAWGDGQHEPPSGEPPSVVYLLVQAPDASGHGTGPIIPTPVRLGLADTTHTEILSGLSEGQVVVTGTIVTAGTSTTSTASTSSSESNKTTNPFAPRGPGGSGPPPR